MANSGDSVPPISIAASPAEPSAGNATATEFGAQPDSGDTDHYA